MGDTPSLARSENKTMKRINLAVLTSCEHVTQVLCQDQNLDTFMLQLRCANEDDSGGRQRTFVSYSEPVISTSPLTSFAHTDLKSLWTQNECQGPFLDASDTANRLQFTPVNPRPLLQSLYVCDPSLLMARLCCIHAVA